VRILRFSWRAFKTLVSGIVLLLFILWMLFKVPAVQNWIADQATAYLSKELETTVSIDQIEVQLFNKALIKGLYVEDQHQDTLLYTDYAEAFFDISEAMAGRLVVTEAHLHSGLFQMQRLKGERQFSFYFLIKYFAKENKDKKEKKKPKFELAIQHIHAHDAHFHLYDEIAGSEINVDVPEGVLHTNYSNLLAQTVFCDSVRLDDPKVRIHVFPGNPMPPNPNPGQPAQIPPKWTVKATKLRVHNMDFKLLNDKLGVKPDVPLDFNDLQLSNAVFIADSLQLENDSLYVNVRKLAAKERRGFVLNSIKGDVFVSPKGAHVKNLEMQTPKSTVGHEIIFQYDEFPDWLDFIHKVKLKAKVKDAEVAVSDIMAFAAPLNDNPFFIANKDKMVKTSFQFRGYVEDFSIRKLILDVENSHVEGELDLRPFDKYMYIKAEELNTNHQDVKSILAFTKLPAEISRLGNINFKGDFSGFFDNDFNTYGDLRTSLGRVYGDLQMNVLGGVERATYDGDLTFDQFQLGKLLNQEDIGIFDAYAAIKGKGLNAQSIDAVVNDGRVNAFEFKGYAYDTIELAGIFKPSYFEGTVKSEDPNFNINLLGVANFTEALPRLTLYGAIHQIDFQKLNLLKDQFVLGIKKLSVDAEGDQIDNFSGELDLEQVYFKRDWGEYFLENLSVAAHDSIQQNDTARVLYVNSDIVDGTIWGKYDEVNLPKTLLAYAQENYPNLIRNFNYAQASDSMALVIMSQDSLNQQDSLEQLALDSLPAQEMHIDLHIADSRNLTEIIDKSFKFIKNANLELNFDSKAKTIDFDIGIDTIRWGGFEIHEERLRGESKDSIFSIVNTLKHMQLNDSTNLPTPYLKLDAVGDSLHYNVEVAEIGKVASEVVLNGNISFLEKAVKTSLSNSGLTVLNQKWLVRGDNYMLFDFANRSLDIQNLRLSDSLDEQIINLQSRGQKGLRCAVENFLLDSLYKPVALPMFDISGRVFASLIIEDVFKQKNLTANVLFDKLVINGDNWNRSRLKVAADSLKAPITGEFLHHGPLADSITASFRFIPAFSTKNPNLKNILDVRLNAEKLKARVLEYFMVGQLTNTEGYANASNVRIYGRLPNLHIRGDAQIYDVKTTVNFLNVRYSMDRARFRLRDDSLFFVPSLNILTKDELERNIALADRKNFTQIQTSNEKSYYVNGGTKVVDEEGNIGYLSGKITHNYLKDWGIDLDIIMKNNLALNTTADSDMPFYGRVFATGLANFSGPFTNMRLSVEGRTNTEISKGKATTKKSVLVLPIMDPVEINQAVDFLVFVDKKAQAAADSLGEDAGRKVVTGGIDVDMKINATPDAMARIIIDEKAGDVIEGSGDGDLHLIYSASGEMDLRGLFVIKEGNYLFTYRNLLNKEFNVDEGGTIRWSGDPFNADIDLRAKYTQKTSLYNLLLSYQDELEANPALKEQANQGVNVDVIMDMKGSLMKPDIAFGLELNTTENNLAISRAKLALRAIQQDESKLNRQVFGLIALQQFMPEEGSGVNVDLAATSFNTLSELITQQFSRHISDLLSEVVEDVGFINSVDFAFDYRLEEGQLNQSGGGSQLGFQLDQTFLQDRLKVSVGANVDFNNQNLNANQKNYIGGDFIIEYAITESGNLKMRAYSRSENDLFGPRIRSGVGISYDREFDSFKELFEDIKLDIQKKREDREKRRAAKKQANNTNPTPNQ
jgi:hypothetical protein